jgi:hypothetical protein
MKNESVRYFLRELIIVFFPFMNIVNSLDMHGYIHKRKVNELLMLSYLNLQLFKLKSREIEI